MMWVYQIIIITEVKINNPVFEESRYMTLIWRIKLLNKIVKEQQRVIYSMAWAGGMDCKLLGVNWGREALFQ